MTLLAVITPLRAQYLCEQVMALTDKDCYLSGERLCVRVDVTLAGGVASPSRVAYVEIADHRQLYAQAVLYLTDGQGWAEIPLPAGMHSGCYQLTAYTSCLRNFGEKCFFRSQVGIINGERLSRRDNIRFLPYARYVSNRELRYELLPKFTYHAGEEVTLMLPPADGRGCAVSLGHSGVHTHLPQGQPSVPSDSVLGPEMRFFPEYEGHIVNARRTDDSKRDVFSSRLVMVGKAATLYDGRLQSDSSTYSYFTQDLSGRLPTIVDAYDREGGSVPLQLSSPFARCLPQPLPLLDVYCQEAELIARATDARHIDAVSRWKMADTLACTLGYMSQEPDYCYDLDEYANMSSIREILIEFVQGVTRRKENGVNKLFTIDRITRQYSSWPALVLLDGLPVYDIDDILEYDSHLVRYVHIYTGNFFFGRSCCQGIISFVTRGGRLSNYKLDAAMHLLSYSFPQDHPVFEPYSVSSHGTLMWCPSVRSRQMVFEAPSAAGTYQICVQGRDSSGQPFRHQVEIVVE